MTDVYQSSARDQKSSGVVTTAAIKAAAFLKERGITPEIAEEYGLNELNGALLIPYRKNGEIKNRKFRAIHEKKFWQDGGKQFVWNYDCLTAQPYEEPLIITEGEFDALSAIQVGFKKTISIPNGGSEGEPNISWLYDIEGLIGAEVILAFDNDDVGFSLLEAVSNFLGKARCKWVKYPKGCKDLNDALKKYGNEGVRQSIINAKWVDVKGAYKMSDLMPLPYRKPMLSGMGQIDNHIRLRFGDFSVLTGVPGHGKTTFINDFINRILERYDLKACFASLENPPQTDHKRMLRTWKSEKLEKYMSDEEKAAADEWIDKKYMFIVPDDDDEVTMEWLLERMETVVLRHGVKIIVIDPWNEMHHQRDKGETITEYTGKAIMLLKSFAKSRGVHVMVVAHPSKPSRDKNGNYPIPNLYDISDSQHWANKADLGIVVYRGEEGDSVRTVKSRHHTEIGNVGVVDILYCPENGRFQCVDNSVLNGRR